MAVASVFGISSSKPTGTGSSCFGMKSFVVWGDGPAACLPLFEAEPGFAGCHLDLLVRRRWRGGSSVVEGHYRPASGRGRVADPPSPAAFQAGCVEAYLASWTARGFCPVTIENDAGVLDRVLGLLGRPRVGGDGR